MLLIVIGYILTKFNIVEDVGAKILTKLENYLFISAFVISTYKFYAKIVRNGMEISALWNSCCFNFRSFPVFPSKLCTKDGYIRKIYTYGLSFANFGFMGNAVVAALFPDIFMEYLVYVLPFRTLFMYGACHFS